MRYKYQATAQDGTGRFLPGATVTVYLADSETLATIYDVASGGSAVSGSVVTSDSTTGWFEFYVDENEYPHNQQLKITMAKGARYNTQTWDYIQIFPDGDRTLITGSAVDQGDAAIVGTLAWYIANNTSGFLNLTLLEGTHTVVTPITATSIDINLAGAGIGKTFIDFSGVSGGGYEMTIQGTATQIAELNATITKGDTTIDFASAHGLSAGDLFMIYNTEDESFSERGATYRQGEYCIVESVTDADTVVVTQPLYATYDSGDDIDVYSVAPVRVEMQDFSVICKDEGYGPAIWHGRGAKFNNLHFSGASKTFLTLNNIYDLAVDRLSIDATGDSTGSNYGIYIGSVQHGTINDCVLNVWQGAHGITTGAAGPIYLPSRDIDMNHITSPGSITQHGNNEYTTIRNCDVREGIFMGGDHGAMINNRAGGDSGVSYLRGMNFRVIGNEFIATSTIGGTGFVFRTGGIGADTIKLNSTFIFSDNIVNGGAYGQGFEWGVMATTGVDVHVHLIGNTFYKNNEFSNSGAGFFKSLIIKNNTFIDGKLDGDDIAADYINVSGNTFYGSDFSMNGASAYTIEVMDILNNNSIEHDNVPYFSGVGVLSVKGNTFLNNDSTGGGVNEASMYIATVKTAIVSGNTWGDSRNEQVQTLSVGYASIINLYDSDNTQVGNYLPESVATVTNRYTGRNQSGLYKSVQGAAAPTTGTWKQGDICWRSDMTASSDPGWVCTVSGTMGTITAKTGDTVSGAAYITDLSNLTDLELGQYIDIAGVTDLGYIKKMIAAITTTAVDAASASGQKVLNVAATTNFAVGESIVIDRAGTPEVGVIASIQSGVSLTLEANLGASYTNESVENIIVTSVAADAAVNGAAVSWDNATWVAMANID